MFPIEPGKDYAVITGDVIGSSNLTAGERRKLPGVLEAAGDALTGWRGDRGRIAPMAVFGGDSWQVLASEFCRALHFALFIRATMLSSELEVDVRMAIAIGGVDFVPEDGIERADGEAFRLSGRLLKDGMQKNVAMGFAHHDPQIERRWEPVVRLVDAIVHTGWTPSRARAVIGAIQGFTQEQTGKLWSSPISKQTVSVHLAESGWEALRFALDEFSLFFQSDGAFPGRLTR